MAKSLTKKESQIHRDTMLTELEDYLTDLTTHNNQAKADKITYWIKDWVEYLKREEYFQPQRLLTYKRGSIIKVNLGFNVGSEEGGLHYAIVVDSDNKASNPVLTVIPLTSVKSEEKLSNMRPDELHLGSEIYDLTVKKLNDLLEKLSDIDLLNASIEDIEKMGNDLEYARRVRDETNKMKNGSIALIGQITTISKLRIYDPRNRYGVLKGLRVSENTLNAIDQKLKEKYFKKF